jgi:uncharacterized membrane protein
MKLSIFKPIGFSLAFLVAVYGFVQYFVFSPQSAGIVKLQQLAANVPYDSWVIFLTFHVAGSALALLLGPFQFSKKLLARKKVHRTIGILYMLGILIGGVSGLYVSAYALGGIVSQIGFTCLDLAWLFTTYMGYKRIREQKVAEHKQWMMRSFALTFAGVTLRIWLVVLAFLFIDVSQLNNPTSVPADFLSVYRWCAWMCWVPNLLLAEILIRRRKDTKRDKQDSRLLPA